MNAPTCLLSSANLDDAEAMLMERTRPDEAHTQLWVEAWGDVTISNDGITVQLTADQWSAMLDVALQLRRGMVPSQPRYSAERVSA